MVLRNIKYGWNCSNQDELYDLDQDPHEMNNLINETKYQTSLREMRQCLSEWMLETNYDGRARNMYRRSRMRA